MALQPITPHISDVDNFLTHCHRRRYPNRATIIYEGDSCDTLYYIISRSVSVVLEDNGGKEVIVAYLNPGDFFGEMGLFEQTEDRSAWCRTRNQSEVAEISYANFNAYVHRHPEIFFYNRSSDDHSSSQHQPQSRRPKFLRRNRPCRQHAYRPSKRTRRNDASARHANSHYTAGDRPHR